MPPLNRTDDNDLTGNNTTGHNTTNEYQLKLGIQHSRTHSKREHNEILASRAKGMDPRHSFGVYPRFDTLFKK